MSTQRYALSMLLYCGSSALSQAQPILATWGPLTSGNFNTPSQWNIGVVPSNGTPPGAAYHALFPAGFYDITINTPLTLDRLTSLGGAPIAGGFLRQAVIVDRTQLQIVDRIDLGPGSRLDVRQNTTISGGAINIDPEARILAATTSNFSNVTINGSLEANTGFSGLFTLNGTLTAGGRDGFVRAFGDLNIGGNAQITLDARLGGPGFTLDPGATLTLAPSVLVRSIAGGFVNRLSGEAPRVVNGAVIRGERTLVFQGVDLTNNALVEILPGGRLTMALTAYRGSGQVVAPAGSTVQFAGYFPESFAGWNINQASVLASGPTNLAGRTITIDSQTGDVTLIGGSFNGGTVRTRDGRALIGLRSEGTELAFNNVAFDGRLEVRGPSRMTLTDGSTTGILMPQASSEFRRAGTWTSSAALDATGSEVWYDGVWSNAAPLSLNGGSLQLSGTWSNTGAIIATNASLLFRGTYSTSSLAQLTRSGGTVTIAGEIDNTNQVLALSDATGTIFASGSIRGGTITSTGSSFLDVRGLTFDGVRLDGQARAIDAPGLPRERLHILNGLTGTGRIVVDDLAASVVLDGSQTIDGITVELHGSNLTLPRSSFQLRSGDIVFGPNLTIRGGGNVGIATTGDTGTLINRGTIIADSPTGNLQVLADSVRSPGLLRVENGARMAVGNFAGVSSGRLFEGTFEVGANSLLSLTPASITDNAASITLTGPNAQFAAIAALTRNSGTFRLLGGQDFAATASFTNAGFLAVGPGSNIQASSVVLEHFSLLELAIEGLGEAQRGLLTSLGPAQLAGTLRIHTDPAHFSRGDSFVLLTASSVAGTFDTLDIPTLDRGLSFTLDYSPTAVILRVIPAPSSAATCVFGALLASHRRRRH